MAISPPSDLILDVAKAADPVSLQAATSRLKSIAVSGSGAGFDLAFTDATNSATAAFNRYSPEASKASGAGKSPAEKFEAMILTQFVETMLPEESEAVFGEGSTGEIWKSMLAEQIANQIAASGGVGIADMISDTLDHGVKA
ncbi:rod-binding protein [Labrenzia sp. 011]|uniref:rod-binding protein n=1 Tax=Labrenzia sp. 011 TaxID=2171494 RepID=UPI000D51364E|nr:rod-binding protein [Labrenzia sp. 011]PVB62697.1 hypothetical protein DCO57_05455 [Labrenzia sp. 011]